MRGHFYERELCAPMHERRENEGGKEMDLLYQLLTSEEKNGVSCWVFLARANLSAYGNSWL